MSLTFSALAQHEQHMASAYMSPPSTPKLDDDTSSECSYYSLPDLQYDRWYRNIPASQVREQASRVPCLPAPRKAAYPRKFHNKERLGLQSCGPWTEYPFCLNKRYAHGNPGPARLIVSSTNPSKVDVVYHPEQNNRKVCLANYRPREYSKGACLKPSPFNPLPANNTFGVPEGMTYPAQEVYQGVGAYYHPQTVPLSPEAAMFSPVYTGSASPVPAWGYGQVGYYAPDYGNQSFY
ncbi:unnamed protein product [Fusarium graminearum]|nr:unnamed protein product [Fusarium graminearum]CZS81012.1 unnamed protein product [Fusarium graminearum]